MHLKLGYLEISTLLQVSSLLSHCSRSVVVVVTILQKRVTFADIHLLKVKGVMERGNKYFECGFFRYEKGLALAPIIVKELV